MNGLNIGLLGYGMIGKVHAQAFNDLPIYHPHALPPIHKVAVCTTRPETARQAAAEAGFADWCTDAEELIARDDVDIVDCSLPNYLHHDVLLAAIRAGKDLIVEKPLAMNTREAAEIAEAARQAGVRVGMIFNYRFVPALMRARQLVEEGFLGQVFHFSAEYLHSGYQSPTRPMSWKLRRSQAGGGSFTDLGAHIVDLVRWLLGEYDQVLATTRTFVTSRPVAAGSAEREPVEVEDAAWVRARMASGAEGMLVTSRFATGILDELRLEIHGERGALRFNLMDANWLYIYDQTAPDEPTGGRRGWTRVETVARYPGAVSPPPRAILGWGRTHAENLFALLAALAKGHEPVPGLVDGVRAHQVIDAAYASAASGNWVKVER